MLFEKIAHWLTTGQDYMQGLDLLRQHGSNRFLLRMLESGPDRVNTARLLAELRKLAEQLKPAAAATTGRAVAAAVVENKDAQKPPSDRDDAPAAIKEVVAMRRELYARARMAHARLEPSGDDQERLLLAAFILNTMDAIAPLWRVTRHFDETGEVIAKISGCDPSQSEDLSGSDDVELNAQFFNDYKYLRKFRTDTRKRDAWRQRLARAMGIRQELMRRESFLYPGLDIDALKFAGNEKSDSADGSREAGLPDPKQ